MELAEWVETLTSEMSRKILKTKYFICYFFTFSTPPSTIVKQKIT